MARHQRGRERHRRTPGGGTGHRQLRAPALPCKCRCRSRMGSSLVVGLLGHGLTVLGTGPPCLPNWPPAWSPSRRWLAELRSYSNAIVMARDALFGTAKIGLIQAGPMILVARIQTRAELWSGSHGLLTAACSSSLYHRGLRRWRLQRARLRPRRHFLRSPSGYIQQSRCVPKFGTRIW